MVNIGGSSSSALALWVCNKVGPVGVATNILEYRDLTKVEAMGQTNHETRGAFFRVKPEDSSPEDCSILRRALLSPLKPSPKNLYLINPPVEFGTNNVFRSSHVSVTSVAPKPVLQDRFSQTTHMLQPLVTVKEETDVFNPQISEEYICPFPGEDESVKDENIDKTSDRVSSAETDSDQDDSDIYPVLL
uniref:Uncharacterized protein n=1 Tax=Timema genevievae TaxID=629358 RepID=A0A7R9K6R0_TIMGE|nr:unnamed protein product [Timema genevievae]